MQMAQKRYWLLTMQAARIVGQRIAKRAKAVGIEAVHWGQEAWAEVSWQDKGDFGDNKGGRLAIELRITTREVPSLLS